MTLKVWYTDFWKDFWFEGTWIYEILSKHYNVIFDKDNPDVLFYSFKDFGQNHKNYNCLKIRVSGECDKYIDDGDFFIGLNKTIHQDNYLWMPFTFISNSLYVDVFNNIDKKRENNGKGTCFMVSNKNARERINIYMWLSLHIKIDSGGNVLNNIGGIIPNNMKSTIDFYKNHKFSISYENESFPGYLTEKIFIPLSCGCIPIYKGDTSIEETVNPKCFINANNLSREEILNKIKEIEENEDMRQSMLNENIMIKPLSYYKDELENFLINIVGKRLHLP